MSLDPIKVRLLQEHLGVPADGSFGPATLGAVMVALGVRMRGPGLMGGAGAVGAVAASEGPLTAKVALELIGHEAIVPEWYKDSVGVGTWGVGVTNASGHAVDRYKDTPQTIARVLEVYIWLLRERYIPDVLEAFAGRDLTEEQFAAALSFHYNTGAIKRASWVKSFMAGKPTQARAQFMEWSKPAAIIGRRTAERDLFFDGKWSQTGKVTVYDVAKPSYSPKWSSARKVDVTAEIKGLLG